MSIISEMSDKPTLTCLVEKMRKCLLDDCKIKLVLIPINGLRSTQRRAFGEYTMENFIFFNDLDGQHNFLSCVLYHSWISTQPSSLFPAPLYSSIPATYQLSPPLDLVRQTSSHTHYYSRLLCSIISNLSISHLWNNSAFPFLSLWSQATEKHWRKLQTYSF